MSYNYLPLDRKWLHFQQVKNLLDYDQLVSITFDGHERIVKCSEYVDSLPNATSEFQTREDGHNLLAQQAYTVGEEVSTEIVKLMLMLKIKSLSYGHSGVHIDTVKRLMEMYNNKVLPVIYTGGTSGAGVYTSALSHLSLPLIGMGEVNYKSVKRKSSEVLNDLNWQPLNLQSNEVAPLITGTQFTSAYGLFILKKIEQLLKIADITAALSLQSAGYSFQAPTEKISVVLKGQMATAAAIQKYMNPGGTVVSKEFKQPPDSFQCIPKLHGAAKDAFDYVLNVFMHEVNTVTETPVVFPDEEQILNNTNSHGQPLAVALDFLSIAIRELANTSETRISHLVNRCDDTKLFSDNNQIDHGLTLLQSAAAAIVIENKQYTVPASVDTVVGNSQHDLASTGAIAATKCLQLINNAEKVLAIELMTAVKTFQLAKAESTPALKQLVYDFNQQVSPPADDNLLHDDILKAVAFIRVYKLQ